MTDINIGAITESLNYKSDRDLRNTDTGSGTDAVVEFQVPTAENNYTWYRKYASGWVEQGGLPTTTSSITFPVEMADDKYWQDVHIIANTSNGISFNTRGYNLSTTGFSYNNATIAINLIRWEVKGMSAGV